MKDDCYTNVPRILTSSGPRSKRGVIKDGTSGYCPKPEDYLSNTPCIETTSGHTGKERPVVCVGTVGHAQAPKSNERVICVGTTDHYQAPKELILNNSSHVFPVAFPTGGPSVKREGIKLLWNPPEFTFNEKMSKFLDHKDMYFRDSNFYTGKASRLISLKATEHIKRLSVPVLRYEGNGGLLVAGQVIWCMPWGDYVNQEQSSALLPSKDYLRAVAAWFLRQKGIIPAPKPEKRNAPIVDLHSRNPEHYFIPYGNGLRDVIKRTITERPKNSWGLKFQPPKADIYGLFTPVLPYAGPVFMLDEDGALIESNQNDPIDYARAVQNGYVGTFKEWQWSELDK